MKYLLATSLGLCLFGFSAISNAYSTYQSGHIVNVTFAGNYALIMLDTPLPDNCVGTPYGWMAVPESSKVMNAFVLGLWLRGDAAQTNVVVYTSGIDGSGYCQINQIDPVG